MKAAFPTPDGGGDEHMWVGVHRLLPDGGYHGSLSNDPGLIPGLRAGDLVDIEDARVSDWVLVDPDGREEGGETIAVLRGH